MVQPMSHAAHGADGANGIENNVDGAVTTISSLRSMNETLKMLVTSLKAPVFQAELESKLHDPDTLPDKESGRLAAEMVDLLDEAKQILEPDQFVLADHFMGYYLSTKSLVAVVSLKIPDLISSKSGNGTGMTVTKLADAAGAREDRLRPVMRLLYNRGIFSYDASSDSYTNNSRSTLLRSDHWTQWHTWVELYGTEFYDMARGIPDSLLKDATRTAAQINYDMDDSIFAYFEKRGWMPRVHRAFGASQVAQAPGILADFPWHEVGDKKVLDLGGGGGALIATLLREYPGMRGGILDLPATVEHARPFFHSPDGQFADVGDRVAPEDLVAGDFLTGPIPRNEVYVIKWCLHNWLDREAIQILRNIREAIIPGEESRLVVLDAVLRDGAMGRLATIGNVQMLMSARGLERTIDDWQRLADASGWNIKQIYTLRNAWVSAIEMRA